MTTQHEQTCLQHLAQVQRSQLADLHRSGIQVDPVLALEIAQPGTDDRFGMNLIARPPAAITAKVLDLRDRLAWQAPEQYFCPLGDLHLTLLEFSHSQTAAQAQALAAQVRAVLPMVLAGLQDDLTVPRLAHPRLIAGRSTCAVRFCARDAALDGLRVGLIDGLNAAGVPVKPRYPPGSAHLTFMRYTGPLTADLADWTAELEATATALADLPEPWPDWQLDTLHLTWGRTWYGMRRGIAELGTFRLEGLKDRRSGAGARVLPPDATRGSAPGRPGGRAIGLTGPRPARPQTASAPPLPCWIY